MITLNKNGEPVEIKEIPIDVKALEEQKSQLEMALTVESKQKDKPDQDTLDFWNEMNFNSADMKEQIQNKLDVINEQLDSIQTQVSAFKTKINGNN